MEFSVTEGPGAREEQGGRQTPTQAYTPPLAQEEGLSPRAEWGSPSSRGAPVSQPEVQCCISGQLGV